MQALREAVVALHTLMRVYGKFSYSSERAEVAIEGENVFAVNAFMTGT
jgi:hypothetical protein